MKHKLSAYENKLKNSYEKGEWKSLGGRSRKSYETLARRQLKQERVNIRLSSDILKKLRQDAAESGITYQTLISSVLYRFARGHLHDDKQIREVVKVLKDVA